MEERAAAALGEGMMVAATEKEAVGSVPAVMAAAEMAMEMEAVADAAAHRVAFLASGSEAVGVTAAASTAAVVAALVVVALDAPVQACDEHTSIRYA